jgi:dipeptidyl aminopeptidase/acylaminoacyl peptidase
MSGTGARITPRPVQGELWRVSLDGQSRKIDIDASKQRVSSYWSPINPDGHFASLGAETGAVRISPIIRAIENFLPAPSGNTVSGQPAAARTAQLAWFDRTGKELRSVGTASAFRGLELSPDGKRVAIHRHDGTGGDIWILDSQSGSSRRLTTDADGTRDNAMPVWSPDGSQILFRSHRNGRWGLYVKRADGTGSEELLVDSVGNTTMSWSPDGKFVVYGINEPKTGDDLWAISLTGDRKAFPLVQSLDNEAWPQISPDGKWIAYNKEDKGIYVRSFPNGIDEWKVSASGIDPRWRADGKELFFLVPNEIVATEFRVAGASVQLSPPRKLFRKSTSNFRDLGGTHHAYAVSPDGQRFLIGIDPTSK